MADPPWQYASPRAIVGNGGRGGGGAATIVQADVEEHYSTMTLDEIKAIPVAASAAKDALLFLWTTNPFLADGSAVEVVRAWGFTPKSVVTWAKVQADGRTPSMKTGWWFRSASEHFIFATRGAPKRPAGFPALPTWQPHGRLPHSSKSDSFYAMAERFADGPCLEMFSRGVPRTPRWTVWGDEAVTTMKK
jgi:N6-adenosine-specific RNA methylase IME4